MTPRSKPIVNYPNNIIQTLPKKQMQLINSRKLPKYEVLSEVDKSPMGDHKCHAATDLSLRCRGGFGGGDLRLQGGGGLKRL